METEALIKSIAEKLDESPAAKDVPIERLYKSLFASMESLWQEIREGRPYRKLAINVAVEALRIAEREESRSR